MRELRTCDFCDGDAAGTFEIVPPELEPTEAEQRRVALCPDCRGRLEGLLEPLLARARDGAAADRAVPDATGDERSDGGSSAATAPTTADAAEPDPDPDSGPKSDSATARADADDGGASLEDGITFERDEHGSDAGSADGTAAGDDDSTAPDAVTESDSDGDDGEDGAATGSRPAAYAKVVRLLRNREFPMDRRAVEDLAAGAYDLEGREVEAIVDYAIEDGEFVEKGETLRRP
ncbi:hypothetical protein HTG_09495 [Natrinema mahii]|nr:hypothetical protein HTG_09495 [Natrinema mahii]